MKVISFDSVSLAAILAGSKTMTRRPLGHKERWHVGDEAWVKTTWIDEHGKKQPAMFCPRRCSPFSIGITEHRIERLRAITAEDVEREGIDVVSHLPLCPDILTIEQLIEMTAWRLFEERWDSIYGKTPSKRWVDNPLVEVLTFEMMLEDK